MTRDEALRTLGLGPEDAAGGLRRAYLRAVRRHPPERDPEGFQRVREAFELLADPRERRRTTSVRPAPAPGDEAPDVGVGPEEAPRPPEARRGEAEASATPEMGTDATAAPAPDAAAPAARGVSVVEGPAAPEAAPEGPAADDDPAEGPAAEGADIDLAAIHAALHALTRDPSPETIDRFMEVSERGVAEGVVAPRFAPLADGILEALVTHRPQVAAAFVEVGRRWTALIGSEVGPSWGPHARIVIARELVALVGRVDEAILATVAEHLLRANAEAAWRALPRLRGGDARCAPTLAQLAEGARRRARRRGRERRALIAANAMGIFAVLMTIYILVAARDGLPDPDALRSELATAVSRCAPKDSPVCRGLGDALGSFEAGDCEGARRAAERAAAAGDAADDDGMAALRAHRAFAELCPKGAP